MDIFKLVGRVMVDSKEAQNSIAKTDSKALGMAKTLGKGITTAAKWATVVTGAAAAIGGAVVAATSKVAEYGDEIDKNSQKMQVSAEQYQKLAFAAERSGTSIETLANANKKLQKSDFSGNMYDAVKSVASINDASERAAKSVELFGSKAGQEMLPLLNSGAEGVQALYDEIESLGGIMSDDAVKAAAAYQDSLTNLQTAFSGFKNRLTADFLPGITSVMDGVAKIISGDMESGKKDVEEGINNIVSVMREMSPQIMEVMQLVMQVLIDNAPLLIDMGFQLAVALLEALFNPENVYKTVYGAIDLLLSVTESIGDAANSEAGQNAIDQLGGAIARAIWDAIKKHFKRNSDNFYAEQDALYGMSDVYGNGKKDGKHASGLNYVPYDGYVAELHRGERVVPTSQNDNGNSADNSDVVNAIEDLKMQMSQMAIVLDDGTIVGKIAPKMNIALGNTYSNDKRRAFA